MQMMSNMPLDFLPMNHPHSRSASTSSRSSPSSRPQSSNGGAGLGMAPTADDLYHASYDLGLHHNSMSNDRGRHASHLSGYNMMSNDGSHQSPNPGHLSLAGHRRPSHLRARAAASPYPRDNESVHSSSSDTEDLAMFLGNSSADYHTMFGGGQQVAHAQETMHPASAFGRMSLGHDHTLEKLAANVRAATTTSASDRAKQIFVQAWYVDRLVRLLPNFLIRLLGSLQTTRHTPMGTYLGRGSTFPTAGSATNTGFHILTPPHWAKQFGFAFLLLKPGAWAFAGIANIIVSLFMYNAVARAG